MALQDPPTPTRRLFWSVVLSTIGLFGLSAAIHARSQGPVVLSSAVLWRTVAMEIALAVIWVPILTRRDWTASCVTQPLVAVDVLRGVGLLALTWIILLCVLVPVFLAFPEALPAFQAAKVKLIGSPSLSSIVVMSLVNPIFEEFLYLGFMANALRGRGRFLAIAAGVLARAPVHVYQGPTNVILIMGIGAVFGAYYDRTRRLWPVVFAHSFIDVIGLMRLSAGAV